MDQTYLSIKKEVESKVTINFKNVLPKPRPLTFIDNFSVSVSLLGLTSVNESKHTTYSFFEGKALGKFYGEMHLLGEPVIY